MKVDIIIPVFNQAEYTRRCLKSLFRFTPLDQFHLILVNNGSTDGTESYLRDISGCGNIDVIENPSNLGWCGALNQGFKKLSPGAEFVLWANNDILFEKDWLPKMIAYFGEGAGAVGPMSNFVIGPQNIIRGNAEKDGETPWLIGFCLMFRREVVDRIGEVDERFSPGGSEEFDYILRMKKDLGYSCRIARDVYIHHYGSRTIMAMDEINGDPELYNKYHERKDKLLREKWGDEVVERWLPVEWREMELKKGSPWPENVKLAWAMPHSMSVINTMTHYSLFGVKRPGMVEYLKVPRGGDIAEKRERQAMDAMERGFTHVWIFDGDMDYPPDTLVDLFRLLDKGASLAGGLVYRGYPPYEPIAWHPTEHRMMLPFQDFKYGDIIAPRATGCACLLVKREVFEKLEQPWFMIKRKENGVDCEEGEDFYFTSRATAAGFKLLINTAYDIDHMREFPVNRELFFITNLVGRILGKKGDWGRFIGLFKKLDDPEWLDRILT